MTTSHCATDGQFSCINSALIGMKTVVSNSTNEEIHERIETNGSNKFSSSGENESEKGKNQKARKAEN